MINIIKYLFDKIDKKLYNLNQLKKFNSRNLCFIIEITLRYLHTIKNECYFFRNIKKFLSKFKI